MGLMGTVVGASAVGIAGVARSATDTLLPGMVEKANHRHQMKFHLHSQRHEAVKCWRTGLAEARDAYRQWAAGPRADDPPNVVGDEWFEGLRPHLPTTGETAKFRTAHEVHCDNPTLTVALTRDRSHRTRVDRRGQRPPPQARIVAGFI